MNKDKTLLVQEYLSAHTTLSYIISNPSKRLKTHIKKPILIINRLQAYIEHEIISTMSNVLPIYLGFLKGCVVLNYSTIIHVLILKYHCMQGYISDGHSISSQHPTHKQHPFGVGVGVIPTLGVMTEEGVWIFCTRRLLNERGSTNNLYFLLKGNQKFHVDIT